GPRSPRRASTGRSLSTMKPIRRKDSSPGRSLPGLEGGGRLSRSGFLSQNRSRDLAESVGHPEKAQVGFPVVGRMPAVDDRLAVVAEVTVGGQVEQKLDAVRQQAFVDGLEGNAAENCALIARARSRHC